MPLMTSVSTEEHSFDFSALGGSMLIFFIMMTIGVLIVVSVSQELCQHALNIVQDFMLSHTSPVRTELMVAEEA